MAILHKWTQTCKKLHSTALLLFPPKMCAMECLWGVQKYQWGLASNAMSVIMSFMEVTKTERECLNFKLGSAHVWGSVKLQIKSFSNSKTILTWCKFIMPQQLKRFSRFNNIFYEGVGGRRNLLFKRIVEQFWEVRTGAKDKNLQDFFPFTYHSKGLDSRKLFQILTVTSASLFNAF